jgi:4-amino-4-deoxy-L-arabinose transferase-like glycosyltransferase
VTSEAGEAALWTAGRQERSGIRSFLTGRKVLFLLFAYFALQVMIRVAVSPSADLDESEQFIFCQKLSWGYGSEPPLYTWIQWPICALLGQTVLALSLVKNALMFCTCCFIYGSARRITGSELCGSAAALSLFFLPQFAWESQRDLTHSVLSATLAAGTLYSLLRLREDRRLGWYLLFGIWAGLGFISKYNYIFWVVGLVLAALSLTQFRESVLDKRMLLSLLICLAIFLPNGLWMLEKRWLARPGT